MKKICSWLLALAAVLGLAGTTHAGALPLIPLCLPQLFGQEPVSSPAQPVQTPDRDADWFSDCLADTLDLLMEYAPEARRLVQALRPCTPYHIAAAAVLEYLAAVDAAQQATDDAPAAAPPANSGNLASYPKMSFCPLASGNPGKVTYRITPDGHVECHVEAARVGPCCQAGCCGACPVDLTFVAGACCNGVECCQAAGQTSAAAKPCKCCEDCKNCNCASRRSRVIPRPS